MQLIASPDPEPVAERVAERRRGVALVAQLQALGVCGVEDLRDDELVAVTEEEHAAWLAGRRPCPFPCYGRLATAATSAECQVVWFERSYACTVSDLPAALRPLLAQTIRDLSADRVALPAVEDVAMRVPPSGRVWYRRRLGNSQWWIHFGRAGARLLLRAVVMPTDT